MKQVVILAGGKGTRLAARLGDLPKPMLPVVGKPLLERQLELARDQGFTDAVLCTGYRGEAIRGHFGDGTGLGIRISYHQESDALGTAGAVRAARDLLAERFVVMYGDTMLDVDLDRMLEAHLGSGADGTLFLHPNDHPHDSDLVELDARGYVRAFHAHPHSPEEYHPNLVNAALYVIERRLVDLIDLTPPCDFARDAFPTIVKSGAARLFGYRSPEYVKDMGTADRHDRVEADVRSGRVDALSLRAPQPAVFIDRDGVLNDCAGYVRSADDLDLYPGVAEAMRRLNKWSPRTVIVTNQPVVARGECSEADLERIHGKLETLLGRSRAYVDRIYFCPHHPDSGFEGERRDLKRICDCRKPATGMLERASRELAIDLARSWMIGDSTTDIEMAARAGLRSMLVRTGHSGQDRKYLRRPDYVADTFTDAVNFITEIHPRMSRSLSVVAERAGSGTLIFVGGLAHSGKSTAASVLREALATRGKPSVIVELDWFLRSATERRGSSLGDAYDQDEIGRLLARLGPHRRTFEIAERYYDRRSRTTLESGRACKIARDDVVIVEGVPALNISPAGCASSRVYVECPEDVRRRRFVRDYSSRDLDPGSIERLYLERHETENGLVRRARATADVIFEEHLA